MGEKDKIEKLLEDYPDVFADIINVLVYQGEEVVKPEELRTTNIRSQYKASDDVLHEEERDTLKEWNNKKVSRYYLELKIRQSKIKDATTCNCIRWSKLSFSDVKERCKRIL